jgi:hypothetical protein
MLSGSSLPLSKQRIVSKDPEVLKAIRYVSIGHIIGLHSPERKPSDTPATNGTTSTNTTATSSTSTTPAASNAPNASAPSVAPKLMNFREQTLAALSGGSTTTTTTTSTGPSKFVLGPASIFQIDILSGPWDFVTVNYADMSPELTAQIHSVNKKVHILTLPDDIKRVETILRYGADGIISKYVLNIQKAWYYVSRDGALPFVD